MLIHFFEAYAELIRLHRDVDPTDALRAAYQNHPHTFLVALLSLLLSIQLFGLGLLALQAKRYHDNLFHLGSTIYRLLAESGGGAMKTVDPSHSGRSKDLRGADRGH
jgi:hypothetical protein